MTPRVEQYLDIEMKMLSNRAQEDRYLDQMDSIWERMTHSERSYLSKRKDIRESFWTEIRDKRKMCYRPR